jgi:hypothetical protein
LFFSENPIAECIFAVPGAEAVFPRLGVRNAEWIIRLWQRTDVTYSVKAVEGAIRRMDRTSSMVDKSSLMRESGRDYRAKRTNLQLCKFEAVEGVVS